MIMLSSKKRYLSGETAKKPLSSSSRPLTTASKTPPLDLWDGKARTTQARRMSLVSPSPCVPGALVRVFVVHEPGFTPEDDSFFRGEGSPLELRIADVFTV